MPWIGEAPLFLVFCGDNLRLRRAAALREKPFPNDNVDMFMNAAVDAALAMQTFTLAAEAAGLGCCPISEVRTHIDRLTELLALPAGVFPVAGLCVGWPEREGFVSMRIPPALAVHEDAYDAAGVEEKIEAYDRRRDARYRVPAERQRAVERFGVADFYGWSEDKARQYSRPARPGVPETTSAARASPSSEPTGEASPPAAFGATRFCPKTGAPRRHQPSPLARETTSRARPDRTHPRHPRESG